MTVSVITDSAAGLPPDVAERHGIAVVPVWLVIGGESIREASVTQEEVLARWDEGVSTSVPTPAEFARAIEDHMTGDGVLVVTVSSSLTGIYQSARMGARDVDGPVRILDSGTAVGAQALVAVAAAGAARGGDSIDGVEMVAAEVRKRVRLAATLGDLQHLVKSGRVPGIARWAGRQLNLNPIVELADGRVHPLRPAFDRDAALDRIVARVSRTRGDGVGLHVAGFHSLDPEAPERMLKEVSSELDPATAFVGEFGPAMVAHAGPGVAGLAWWWEEAAA